MVVGKLPDDRQTRNGIPRRMGTCPPLEVVLCILYNIHTSFLYYAVCSVEASGIFNFTPILLFTHPVLVWENVKNVNYASFLTYSITSSALFYHITCNTLIINYCHKLWLIMRICHTSLRQIIFILILTSLWRKRSSIVLWQKICSKNVLIIPKV